MSVAVRRALYGKLAGDSTLTAMLHAPPTGHSKSIFGPGVAPAGALFPYIIFQKQASTPRYAMQTVSAAAAMDVDVWLIKGVDKSDSADVVDGIASRLSDLLTDASLSISGKTHLLLRRDSDVDYPEIQDGVTYFHAGALYRLIVTA